MSGEAEDTERVLARLQALERFGFPRQAMDEFLEDYEGGVHDRLDWLEERRETASEIEDRIVALSQISAARAEGLNLFREEIYDPFSVEEVYVVFEREMRTIVSWEPPLNRHKHLWFGNGFGESWALLYRRLAALDPSSAGAVEPLQALFDHPERYDEIFRLLQTVEADEARQKRVIEQAVGDLNNHGYDVGDIESLPLLEALNVLDAWQEFHNQREQVRLSVAQLIEPFDRALAFDFEQRCAAIQHLENEADVRDLHQEINALAQTLETRRQDLSEIIAAWRQQGIVFPHQGDLHPRELMEWETNHDVIAQSVSEHLALVERWKRFEMYWPTRAAPSAEYIGHLDQTETLQNVVDELDALWKKAELDALDILQGYDNEGLHVDEWRRKVFEDPLHALERLVASSDVFARRISLKRRLMALDVSFSGSEDVDVRLQILSAEDIGEDVLDEVEAFVQRTERRNDRHRVMLEEELAALRIAGTLAEEVNTNNLTIQELERHVGGLQRYPSGTGIVNRGISDSVFQSLEHEINTLQHQGWNVEVWLEQLSQEPLAVAQSLSRARSWMEEHDVLRRRLQRLPWNRDMALAAQVELRLKQPDRLEDMARSIPQWAIHLAERPVEDEMYVLQAWQPQPSRPTLVPVPESLERPVLQPATALDDAHEAMLEAMDEQREHGEENDVQPVPLNNNAPAMEDVVVQPVETPVVETNDNSEPVETELKTPVAHDMNEPPAVETSEEREPVVIEQDVPVGNEVIVPQAEVMHADADATEETDEALRHLGALLAAMGLTAMATEVHAQGMNAIGEVRRGLAQHVNVEPRDVRVARLLRLTLRLLPEGNSEDGQRAALLASLHTLIPPLKRWMRRRLEARHSGAKGDFLADAMELGVALNRIPGLGKRVPLEKDAWPLPQELAGLADEVRRLQAVVELPSAGGVQA
jgi:hypothetical protein